MATQTPIDDKYKHSFSIELTSKEQLIGVNLPHDCTQSLLIEGSLGELVQISLVESVMLEVHCTKGIIRMDLTEDEYRKALSKSGG